VVTECVCTRGYMCTSDSAGSNSSLSATWFVFLSLQLPSTLEGITVSFPVRILQLSVAMVADTLETLLQVTSVQVVIDGKSSPAVTVDGTELILACNKRDQALVMTAVQEYADQVGPLLAKAIRSRVHPDQATIEVKMKQDWVTSPIDKVAMKTVVAAITKERLVNKDPGVVARVDWLAHGLKLGSNDSYVGAVVITVRSGQVYGADSAVTKQSQRASVPPKHLIAVRSNTRLCLRVGLHVAH